MATTYGGERDASTTFARNATPTPSPETKKDVTGFPAEGTVLGYRYLGGLNAKNATDRYVKIADGNGGVTETFEPNPEYKTAAEQAKESGTYVPTLAANVKEASVKKLIKTIDNKDGTFTEVYEDGTTKITGTKTPSGVPGAGAGGQSYTATDGTKFTDQSSYVNYQKALDTAKTAATTAFNERVSAYSLLKSEFEKYGLGSLVGDIRSLAEKNLSPSEFSIELRNTKAYQDRFAGNAARIKAGYGAISEAAYIGLEDSYQSTMRRYGLPESYWAKDAMGTQAEFQKFIAGDVSPIELEDRIQLAVNRVNNASPEVMQSLTQFYPGITKGNLLAYVLDPQKALPLIQRQIQAAEIGGAALQSGLSSNVTRAEQLAAAGITQQQAQQGYGAIGGGLQRGSELASVYGESPYTQTTAESEIFNLPGQQEAAKQRKKLTGLEKATFGGTTGLTGGALARERAGQY